MVAVGTVIFIGLVLLVDILLAGSLVYSATLGLYTRESRASRVLFGSLATLKLWVFLVLAYFSLGVVVPELVQPWREWARYFFVLYLLVQSLGVLVALERWRRGL